jgi:hypothetical protein
MDFLEVAQHPGDDVPDGAALQVKAQRYLELVDQPAAPLVGLEPLGQLLRATATAR